LNLFRDIFPAARCVLLICFLSTTNTPQLAAGIFYCRIARVTAGGAYDGAPTYDTIAAHGDDIENVIPPRSAAVLSGGQGPLEQRDRHLDMITENGRLAWQKATDYEQRSLVETTMGRYKALIGPRLRVRCFAAQQTEAAIGVAVLNRMFAAGRSDCVRFLHVIV
jgi:hypothetical protein